MPFSGFCVGGYNWPAPEVPTGVGRSEELGLRRALAAEDARLTRRLGGNLLRSFWSMESLFVGEPAPLAAALNALGAAELRHSSVFLLTDEERIARLDLADAAMDGLLAAVGGDSEGPFTLDLELLDAVLGGLEDANRDGEGEVALLLSLVSLPPRLILEAPSDAQLQNAGRGYTFASLWERYVRLHQEVHRVLVRRFAVERPRTGLRALEIVNEPDYLWVPEEVKIEWGGDGLLNPIGKYVTELHLPQVPMSDRPWQPFARAPWGFQEQDGPWSEADLGRGTPVLEFDWGSKFDWYVTCYARLLAHTAWAIKDEAANHGVEVITVSGSVTHNNIDYLLRVHRAEPTAFSWVDKIGLHPYHWVHNDVWDSRFVAESSVEGWHRADPRTFAGEHFKRFDFLQAFTASSGEPTLDAEIREAFGDRPLWITEFGIGSKVLGAFNAPVADVTRFIRPQSLVGGTAGYPDVVWEDLWDAFLDQVGWGWLRAQNVECVLLYALRELGMSGFDLDDEDRSNLALLRRDGSPRLAAAAIERISGLLGTISGRTSIAPAGDEQAGGRVPPELPRRSWRSVELSERETAVMTMLSVEERQMLHWLTASYYRGAGGIVDGGCFVGGSTVPLAEGLRASAHDAVIDVYDLFEVEPYMTDFYFRETDLRAGDSFRPVFDANTAHVSDLLRVHEGDLTLAGWGGGAIEILFIDFAKSWALNDFIVAEFFHHLIPGRSIVVQQDYVFAGCPWVILTMEALADYFEPVAFAEYSSVLYLCTRELPAELPAVASLEPEERLRLVDRSIARFRGYAQDELRCAKAALLVDAGEEEQAMRILDEVEQANGSHFAVAPAIALVRSLLVRS